MSEVPKKENESIQQDIAALVQRALIQAGDLQAAEEKLKRIVERISEITPQDNCPE